LGPIHRQICKIMSALRLSGCWGAMSIQSMYRDVPHLALQVMDVSVNACIGLRPLPVGRAGQDKQARSVRKQQAGDREHQHRALHLLWGACSCT
jgi:hypothetical protein